MKRNTFFNHITLLSLTILLLGFLMRAEAAIEGLKGKAFTFTAKAGRISTPDGHSLLGWGYSAGGGLMQYPGPTIIVHVGDTVTINLTNELPMPVSMVFPGQENVTATGGAAGLITREALPGGASTVTYSFVASRPGTYMYHSGTRPELQIEMGLFGAIIVRPANHMQAYNHASTTFKYENLFVLSEMDPRIHQLVEAGKINEIDFTSYWPVLWFINGRCAPDTMADNNVPWLPHQPYSAMAMTHPGEKLLVRVVNAGRDLHPFHTHGNNMSIIARDGRLLESTSGAGADLAVSEYTLKAIPGQTYDALFEWTGKDLGWDIYGHATGDPLQPLEYAADHGKPFPVTLPEKQSVSFGGAYSGSPFLGTLESLPPGQGGLNIDGGLFFMWHSHTEKEMVNDNIFPGGMMTMLIVQPPWVPIGMKNGGQK